ncbi:hypothetical protein C8J57DRAFT_1724786 [Mycena rebaudengoi]|nr:hypothetical protein C8J57DRAFT_1724786 [Mycena rebaudengoi]
MCIKTADIQDATTLETNEVHTAHSPPPLVVTNSPGACLPVNAGIMCQSFRNANDDISSKNSIGSLNPPQKVELYRRWREYTVHAPQSAPTTLRKDWHKPAQPLPMPWHPTSDWEKWEGRHLWLDTLDGTPLIEMFKAAFAIPGTIEPVAMSIDGSDGFFAFATDGQYYLYDDGTVQRFEGEFASKDDFLQRGLPGHGREQSSAPSHPVPPQPGYEDVHWLPGY